MNISQQVPIFNTNLPVNPVIPQTGTSNERIQEPDPFKVERNNGDVSVRLINPVLIEILRRYLQAESLYERNPKIPAHELFLILPKLKKVIGQDSGQKNDTQKTQESPEIEADDIIDFRIQPHLYNTPYGGPYYNNVHLKSLVDLIEKEYESRVCEIKEMIDNRVISFKNLFYLFTKGQDAYALWNGCIIGAKITRTTYHRTIAGDYMSIFTEIIDSEWEGVCEIEKLAVVPLPEESPIHNQLVERGRKFGRVMIDSVSFFKINPSYNMGTTKRIPQNNYYYTVPAVPQPQDFNDEKSVKEEELFMCVPSLYGFSFTTKKWGQLYVEFLDEILFDDDAFDQLVMDPIKKDLIFSLVTSKHKGVDLISGKGGGCVFLLHGPPGVGKTLTAEAISEYLHLPLYAVSVGELGISVVKLERKLSEILEVASVWNAVILIDEADIFLERRSEHDIQRNTLVSVFLRLLEYHQGILFLTTNRVKCFDAAFQSRISVALKYNDLNTDAREKVWRTFLDRIEGKNKSQVDIENLKKRPLNGREIKTAVRLAKALTTKDNPDALITTKQLETILDISKSFGEELEIWI
ncbi:8283_t:CDS:10, partial [Rhizophagus irregularis]